MQNDSGFDLPEGLELRREQDGLTLAGSGMELRQDFREMLPRVRRNRLGRELLVRAARVRSLEGVPHRLERPCEDSEGEELLAAAIAARPRKVVVKRPVKGPYLANVKPSHSVTGKAVRYDVIVPAPRG